MLSSPQIRVTSAVQGAMFNEVIAKQLRQFSVKSPVHPVKIKGVMFLFVLQFRVISVIRLLQCRSDRLHEWQSMLTMAEHPTMSRVVMTALSEQSSVVR
jgi:hypothetical protein